MWRAGGRKPSRSRAWVGTRAGITTMKVVKCKIQVIQQQAQDIEERAHHLQQEVEREWKAWEQAKVEEASLNCSIQLIEEELDSAQERLAIAL